MRSTNENRGQHGGCRRNQRNRRQGNRNQSNRTANLECRGAVQKVQPTSGGHVHQSRPTTSEENRNRTVQGPNVRHVEAEKGECSGGVSKTAWQQKNTKARDEVKNGRAAERNDIRLERVKEDLTSRNGKSERNSESSPLSGKGNIATPESPEMTTPKYSTDAVDEETESPKHQEFYYQRMVILNALRRPNESAMPQLLCKDMKIIREVFKVLPQSLDLFLEVKNNRTSQAPPQVTLTKAENAWKPSWKSGNGAEQTVINELKKKTRTLLNKLTLKNIDQLIKDMKDIMNSCESDIMLNEVVSIIFEKAIHEPTLCTSYSKMCAYLLSFAEPPLVDDTIVDCQLQGEKRKLLLHLLLTKCQLLFEATINWTNNRPQANMSSTEEPEADSEKMRERSIGNACFIGQLLNYGVLTPSILFRCFNDLMQGIDEHKIELLNKFISTSGHLISKHADAGEITNMLDNFEKCASKVELTSRAKFMLMDVMDYRKKHLKMFKKG